MYCMILKLYRLGQEWKEANSLAPLHFYKKTHHFIFRLPLSLDSLYRSLYLALVRIGGYRISHVSGHIHDLTIMQLWWQVLSLSDCINVVSKLKWRCKNVVLCYDVDGLWCWISVENLFTSKYIFVTLYSIG